MNNYGFITSPRKLVVAATSIVLALVLFVGVSSSSAQDATLVQPPAPAHEVANLTRLVALKDVRIAILEQQLALAQQAAIEAEQGRGGQRDTVLTSQEAGRLGPESAASALDEWRVGYTIGGGKNLSAFEKVILPCESGGEPDPDAAIGPTDDWGRAQINRPTWSGRFEELTGMPFEDGIRDPILNGYMSARVEIEHPTGLNAWTCWRRR